MCYLLSLIKTTIYKQKIFLLRTLRTLIIYIKGPYFVTLPPSLQNIRADPIVVSARLNFCHRSVGLLCLGNSDEQSIHH